MGFYITHFIIQISNGCAFAIKGSHLGMKHPFRVVEGTTTQLLVYGARLMEDLVQFQDSLVPS